MSSAMFLTYSSIVPPPSLNTPSKTSNKVLRWIYDHPAPNSGLYALIAGIDPWIAFENYCRKYEFGYKLSTFMKEDTAHNRVFWIYKLSGTVSTISNV